MEELVSKSGKRIILRVPSNDDVELLYGYGKEIEKEDTFILLNPDEPLTMKDEKTYVKTLSKDILEKKKVAYLALDGEKMIGSCEVKRLLKRQGHVGVLGITILKEYRGDGIGKKLLLFVIEKARKNLGVSQIILNCFANNTVACGLYESVGFREYGLHPKAILYKGQLIDEKMFVKEL